METNTLESSDSEDIVWHYTTATGLLGILENGCIWASSINFLNDATENLKAKQLLRKSVERHFNGQIQDEFKEMLVALRDANVNTDTFTSAGYRQLLSDLLNSAVWNRSDDNIFVACFSGRRDSLSQWRAYTAVGGSYAIGFAKNDLHKLFAYPYEKQSKDFVRRRFGPVEYYSKRKHDEAFGELAKALIVQAAKPDSTLDSLVELLSGDSSFFKDNAFEEEKEWRLVCSGNMDYINVQFRPGRSNLIPYITVPLAGVPVKEIVVGPGPSRDLDERALNSLVNARHCQYQITRSDVPFRNW